MAKFIFVTGGVVSGLGKGITAASLGRLLKCRGLKVASQKLDPYVNVDPGTMSPLQHGEVFVTDDGTETDLDLGHYERFIDENLNKYSNLTTGKVYWNVLNKERQGAYLGQTVQIIPHITNEIKSYIYNLASSTEADVVITEIGGTTGDIESQPFLEAIRQVGLEQGKENCCFIHVVLVPYISGSDEYKSKPAQHSVKELQGMGVSPDIIILRADGSVGSDIRRKISTFCNVRPECVIENLTMPSLYQCPLMLHTGGLDDVVVKQLHLDVPPADLTEWKEMLARIATRSKTCTIALVGKYVKLHDAYLSVMESLYHAGFENDSQVEIKWVESEDLPDQAACKEAFADVDGIIVNHIMLAIRGEFAGICILVAQNAPGKLHHHDLHAKADAKVGNMVLAGILCSLDHALNAAVTKAAGYDDAVHICKGFLAGGLIGQILAFHPADFHLTVILKPGMI